MKISTTENLSKNEEVIEVLGIARGSTVRARNIARDVFASFRNVIGGEIVEYTKLLADSREEAVSRMKKDAEKMGADAVISVRFNTSTIAHGSSEMLAYGTAVKINK